MASKFRLIDFSSQNDDINRKRARPIDWSLCILCQEVKNEILTNPSQNKRLKPDASEGIEGFETLTRNLKEFDRIGKLPCAVPLSVLDAGPGIKENLEQNNAQYHKNCFLKCADSKLIKAQKQNQENVPPCTPSPLPTRRSIGLSPNESEPVCISCGKVGSRGSPLQRVLDKGAAALSTQAINKCDTKVLVSLQGKEVWCHKRCRSAYTYQYKANEKSTPRTSSTEVRNESLQKVVQHISAVKENVSESPVFNMADLTRMYSTELNEQGITTPAHSSRLKDKILEECPYLEVSGTPGQKSFVRYKADVDKMLREQCSKNKDGKSIIQRVADEVRKDIFAHDPTGFQDMTCVEGCVPATLMNLVKLIIDGKEYAENSEPDNTVSSLAQLLYFHATKNRRNDLTHRRHDAKRECPLPVYVATKIYAETRKKEIIDKFYQLGICISYDRLQSIITAKANKSCQQYKADGVVVPKCMELEAFTTGQVDNLDYDPSSMTAKNSFHGTVISLIQHGPEGRPRVSPTGPSRGGVLELPADYIVVPPSLLDVKQAQCTQSAVSKLDLSTASEPREQEFGWLESCRDDSTLDTWPAFHSKQETPGLHKCRTAVLPAFRDKSQSVSMMSHSLGVIMKGTRFLNPSQIPVAVADEPLYALLKQLQWLRPNVFGEDKVFIMMGALHIEMAALRVVGGWLEGSGWTSALVSAGITTPGRAEAVISVNHVTRARYAHQVTAAVLHQLKQEAYEEYSCDDPMTNEQWCDNMRKCPQFRFWDIVLSMELIVLQIVRALRTGNFPLYNEAISRIVPYLFALDHHNYARWLPVHIRDNIELEKRHPTLWAQFMNGYFVADKTGRLFSKIGLDHAHEQLNATLKGDGGMIGLTEDPAEMLKWMVCAPEMADMCSKFEDKYLKVNDYDDRHHFDSNSARKLFLKDKSSLLDVFRNSGNPFSNDGPDLFNIDTRQCCHQKVVDTVLTIEELGNRQYTTFCEERLRTRKVSIHFKIAKNQLPTFSRSPKTVVVDKTKAQMKSMKKDLNLFSHMWVAISNNRPAELDEFFSHENQMFPPSLATIDGKMRGVTKADLVDKCLGPLYTSTPPAAPVVDCKIIDGAALVHMLKPGLCVHFSDFIKIVYLPFIDDECKDVQRLDVILDEYVENSLKSSTREKRGEGPPLKVELDTKIPGKEKEWIAFLRNSKNKEQFFKLLANAIVNQDSRVEIHATRGDCVVTNFNRTDMEGIAPCNHEEADTRIFVHVADAVRRGASSVLIRASDADVVALACACFPQLPALKELWVHRPTSKQHRMLPIHEISASLGPEKSRALPAFHAFTGCDNVEGFYGIGKKTAWNAMDLQPDAVPALLELSKMEINSPVLSDFVVAMYSPSKKYRNVNVCRRGMFSTTSRPLEGIPPCEDSLDLHIRRALYQTQVWHQLLRPQQVLPSPLAWGYQLEEGQIKPLWRRKPQFSERSISLTSCKCKTVCKGNCSCKDIGCCDLCKCNCAKSYD